LGGCCNDIAVEAAEVRAVVTGTADQEWEASAIELKGVVQQLNAVNNAGRILIEGTVASSSAVTITGTSIKCPLIHHRQ